MVKEKKRKVNNRKIRRKWESLGRFAATTDEKRAAYDRRLAALWNVPFRLHFRHIPWPVFHHLPSKDDITDERVALFFKICMDEGEYKKQLRYWHPDKFMPMILKHVVKVHQEDVGQAAYRVSQILLNMWK